MEESALPNFRKLYGRIEGGIAEGEYHLMIENNYDVDPFEGKKYFVITNAPTLGGNTWYIALIYVAISLLCLIAAGVFTIAY